MTNRQLVYRFLELPHVTRVRIAVELNLLTQKEVDETHRNDETLLWAKMFRQATANGQMSELVGEVETAMEDLKR